MQTGVEHVPGAVTPKPPTQDPVVHCPTRPDSVQWHTWQPSKYVAHPGSQNFGTVVVVVVNVVLVAVTDVIVVVVVVVVVSVALVVVPVVVVVVVEVSVADVVVMVVVVVVVSVDVVVVVVVVEVHRLNLASSARFAEAAETSADELPHCSLSKLSRPRARRASCRRPSAATVNAAASPTSTATRIALDAAPSASSV